jgi:BMFP domain-containing protein YqiC
MRIVEKRAYIQNHLHQIDDSLIDEVFNKIYSQIGNETQELSDELKSALDKGLESLDRGKISSHEDVMVRIRTKFPTLIK